MSRQAGAVRKDRMQSGLARQLAEQTGRCSQEGQQQSGQARQLAEQTGRCGQGRTGSRVDRRGSWLRRQAGVAEETGKAVG